MHPRHVWVGVMTNAAFAVHRVGVIANGCLTTLLLRQRTFIY